MRDEQQLLGAVATEGTQRDRSMAGYVLGDRGLEPDPELSASGCLEGRLPPVPGAPEALGEREVELPHAQRCHQPPQRLREEPVVRDCGQRQSLPISSPDPCP